MAMLLPYNANNEKIEWINNKKDSVAIERVIENGTYYISTKIDGNKVIDIDNASKEDKAKVQIWNRNETDAQKFVITSIGNGYYTIKAKHSGKALDVSGKGQKKGTKVQQYTPADTDAQRWEFEYAGNGYYYLKSKCSGLYLDVTDGKATNGNQLQIWTSNKTEAQKFKFEKINEETKYDNFELVMLKPKKGGTATVTTKLSNGIEKTCKVTIKENYLGYGGEKADSLIYIQHTNKGYPISGGSTSKYMACDAVSLTHAVILLTGNYSITPNSLYKDAVLMYGAAKVNSKFFDSCSTKTNANITILRQMCKAKYDIKYRNVVKENWTVKEIKNILKNKHVVLIGENNTYFYKPNGSKRKHKGHTVMFYKYENGIFYAKDSASDGGAMCPYTEKYAKEFFKNAIYITEYYK